MILNIPIHMEHNNCTQSNNKATGNSFAHGKTILHK